MRRTQWQLNWNTKTRFFHPWWLWLRFKNRKDWGDCGKTPWHHELCRYDTDKTGEWTCYVCGAKVTIKPIVWP